MKRLVVATLAVGLLVGCTSTTASIPSTPMIYRSEPATQVYTPPAEEPREIQRLRSSLRSAAICYYSDLVSSDLAGRAQGVFIRDYNRKYGRLTPRAEDNLTEDANSEALDFIEWRKSNNKPISKELRTLCKTLAGVVNPK